MIKLCGFRVSNYHNKVRLVLLERGIPFDEDCEVKPSQKDEYTAKSPMGKVPYLEVDGERIRESIGMGLVETMQLHFPTWDEKLRGQIADGYRRLWRAEYKDRVALFPDSFATIRALTPQPGPARCCVWATGSPASDRFSLTPARSTTFARWNA